ncbi:MAG TPA: protein kinase [Vicinamibacterales bacterium]
MTGSSRLGPYVIFEPLGAGGMGEVFRAHDPRLQRDVAIKIVAARHSSDPAAVARMVRESRIVASLNHPNIVSIFDVGEDEGRFYLVTELIEGETLRARLRRGVLPAREALDGAIAIASALAAAHARGVIHRDLKPENVMVTATGAVKVLDFGVAKAIASPDAATAPPIATLTATGAAIGTPSYMAPEQLEGRAIDHRVDQFSFGILLYEMLTGRRPFKGATAAEVAASILRDEPEHLSGVRADLPPATGRIVARCLAKNPDQRYASTADLVHALTDARDDLGLVTPAAVATVARRPAYVWVAAVTTVAIVAAVIAGLRGGDVEPAVAANRSTPHTVVVLPFSTIGDGQAYIAAGLTEALSRELGHVNGTRVISANSAFAYKGGADDAERIARELGANVIVRGSVQSAGERVRISAMLIDGRDSSTLWSNRYDRGTADILSVQDDIAWQVATKLAATFGATPPPRPVATPKTTPEAYDAFLRGRNLMRGSATQYAAGIAELETAVMLDPAFALARAHLASAYTQQFFYNAADPELERKAFVEIEKAVAINPDLGEAYLARAQLTWNLRNGFPHERAIADLRRAIASNPNLAEAHIELGKLYYHIGLTPESIAANEEASQLDPRSLVALYRQLGAKIDAGMTEAVSDTLARNPQWPARQRVAAMSYLGLTEQAIATLAPNGVSREQLEKIEMNDVALLAQLLARAGKRQDAERALQLAIPLAANPTGLSDTHHAQFAIGCAYASLGDRDKAVEWVTKAANEGYPSYPRFSSERDLVSLGGHPAFDALLERLRRDHQRWRKTLT